MFIAMGCYEGETLKQRIARGPLSIEEALDTAVQMAQGLSEAHAADIVHRDIKPANVMLSTGFAVWSLTRPAPPPRGLVSRFPIPLAADQNFSGPGRPFVAISPDGSHVVYAANQSLWLRPVDQLQALKWRGPKKLVDHSSQPTGNRSGSGPLGS